MNPPGVKWATQPHAAIPRIIICAPNNKTTTAASGRPQLHAAIRPGWAIQFTAISAAL